MKEKEEKERKGEKKKARTKEELDSLLFSSLLFSLAFAVRGFPRRTRTSNERKEGEGKIASSSNDYPERGKSFVLEKPGLRRVCPRSISPDLASLPSTLFFVSTLYTFRRYVHFVS